MREVKELLAQMRNCFLKLRQDGQNVLAAEAALAAEGHAESDKLGATLMKEDAAGVGEIMEQGEFGLGIAPRDSKPINKIELTKEKEAEI